MGVFAEFERAIIQERVKAGLKRARDQGKRLGRPRIAADTERHAREQLLAGMGIAKAASVVGVGVSRPCASGHHSRRQSTRPCERQDSRAIRINH
jgi:DNA invertase Pin-like site-specific DNA recombinase